MLSIIHELTYSIANAGIIGLSVIWIIMPLVGYCLGRWHAEFEVCVINRNAAEEESLFCGHLTTKDGLLVIGQHRFEEMRRSWNDPETEGTARVGYAPASSIDLG